MSPLAHFGALHGSLRGSTAHNLLARLQISHEAKDLIRSLLRKRPEKRLTLERVESHPWIARHEHTIAPESEYRPRAHA
jgi:serine/threonine protein kinase